MLRETSASNRPNRKIGPEVTAAPLGRSRKAGIIACRFQPGSAVLLTRSPQSNYLVTISSFDLGPAQTHYAPRQDGVLGRGDAMNRSAWSAVARLILWTTLILLACSVGMVLRKGG